MTTWRELPAERRAPIIEQLRAAMTWDGDAAADYLEAAAGDAATIDEPRSLPGWCDLCGCAMVNLGARYPEAWPPEASLAFEVPKLSGGVRIVEAQDFDRHHVETRDENDNYHGFDFGSFVRNAKPLTPAAVEFLAAVAAMAVAS